MLKPSVYTDLANHDQKIEYICASNPFGDAIRRLERLEAVCAIEKVANRDKQLLDSKSAASVVLEISGNTSAKPSIDVSPIVRGNDLNCIESIQNRCKLSFNVFSHLEMIESRYFQNEGCVKAVLAALEQIEYLPEAAFNNLPVAPTIPKEQANRLIRNYYESCRFKGFTIPVEESFLISIPDLKNNPHVQLDYTSQIIYHAVLVQGILLDPECQPGIEISTELAELLCVAGWKRFKITQPISSRRFLWQTHLTNFQISVALEGCDCDLSWEMLGLACRIARTLGYFSVDTDQGEDRSLSPSVQNTIADDTETDKNQKRFVFWHLFRTDCFFRLAFRKPNLITKGCWKVNFPDLTINGIDDESFHLIQIHFLVSMRIALLSMKFLDWIDFQSTLDPASHDAVVEGYIEELHSILSNWHLEELLGRSRTRFDTYFCTDMLFSSYKLLIALNQSKKCNQDKHTLPPETVKISRKLLRLSQSLLGTSLPAFWGISLVLVHHFVPFFILCLAITGDINHDEIEDDLILVTWLSKYVENASKERIDFKSVSFVMSIMTVACQKQEVKRFTTLV
ncbi:uncharacterized protein N7469_001860 [Penicillium citrinum]|uniref:Xylanolytic transcriptional activator regulatory domain-containing protein n=1 Tax=Penicillium citrinum TaxID=5077 RepID=A0A9W9TWC3_PENCI|nr:uncharacterized protein N7469_001860 [Penicillium citrinum]KAJ5243533.1 hypothetical protein N7469_001860 [Penicillium citrinum]